MLGHILYVPHAYMRGEVVMSIAIVTIELLDDELGVVHGLPS